MHPVVVTRRRGTNGVEVLRWDAAGAVFAPAPERGVTRPAYAYGPPGARVKTPVFTCPVSAIPEAVWQLFELWIACRAMKLPPKPGGAVDQPIVVQRAFPAFEAAMEQLERRRNQDTSLAAMTALLGAAFGGGRRPRR
jgi:hypothetical protein